MAVKGSEVRAEDISVKVVPGKARRTRSATASNTSIASFSVGLTGVDRPLSRMSMQNQVEFVRDGVASGVAFELQNALGAASDELERIVGISYRTLLRYRKSGSRLSPVATDRIARSIRVMDDIYETLGGGEDVAKAWLHRPCKPLGGVLPIELMDTDAGLNEIEDVLGRIRHGIFS